MSLTGTKLPCRSGRPMSETRGRADEPGIDVRADPQQTWWWSRGRCLAPCVKHDRSGLDFDGRTAPRPPRQGSCGKDKNGRRSSCTVAQRPSLQRPTHHLGSHVRELRCHPASLADPRSRRRGVVQTIHGDELSGLCKGLQPTSFGRVSSLETQSVWAFLSASHCRGLHSSECSGT